MSEFPKYGDKTSYGFFLDNVQRSIINDMYSSGNPDGYWYTLTWVIDDLRYYIDDHSDWEDKLKEVWEAQP